MTILNQKIVDTVEQLRFASENMPHIWDGSTMVFDTTSYKAG